jgi:hypothetical protein
MTIANMNGKEMEVTTFKKKMETLRQRNEKMNEFDQAKNKEKMMR